MIYENKMKERKKLSDGIDIGVLEGCCRPQFVVL